MAYVTLLSATEKYNRTLTIALMKAVNHFIGKSASVTFPAFKVSVPDWTLTLKIYSIAIIVSMFSIQNRQSNSTLNQTYYPFNQASIVGRLTIRRQE